MKTQIFDSKEVAALSVAETIKNICISKPSPVLCLAAGETSLPIFDKLIQWNKEGSLDFSNVRIIGLDEWLGIPMDMQGSCAYFLRTNLFNHINLAPENIRLFNSMPNDAHKECHCIEQTIAEWGGIDYLLLGMGMNGHLGLNEPSDNFSCGAFVCPLDDTTIHVAPKYFPQGMPPITAGITLGIQNLLACKVIQLAVFGDKKQPIVTKLLQSAPTPRFPASILHTAEHASLILDSEAAGRCKE